MKLHERLAWIRKAVRHTLDCEHFLPDPDGTQGLRDCPRCEAIRAYLDGADEDDADAF